MRYTVKRHTGDEELGKGRSPAAGGRGSCDASRRAEGMVPTSETCGKRTVRSMGVFERRELTNGGRDGS
jgi:hypothetical protein